MNNQKNNRNQYPVVTAIIVNWNGADLLPECLDSLQLQTYPNMNVVVVDNGSKDNSIEILKKYPVHVVALDKNTGFSGGNNAGYRYVKKSFPSKYVILLNNDTKVAVDWCEKLVTTAEKYPDAGSVGSKVLFYDDKKMIHSAGTQPKIDFSIDNRSMYQKDTGQYKKVEKVFGSIGCSILVRVDALGDEDVFDDLYFAYAEDDDLAWRLRYRGYNNYLNPESVIWHKHSMTSQPLSPFKLFYTERNRVFNLLKFAPLWLIIPSLYFSVLRMYKKSKAKHVKEGMQKHGLSKFKAMLIVLKAYGQALLHLRHTLKRRVKIQKLRRNSNVKFMDIYGEYGVSENAAAE